jgi:hypothetical protein
VTHVLRGVGRCAEGGLPGLLHVRLQLRLERRVAHAQVAHLAAQLLPVLGGGAWSRESEGREGERVSEV